MIMLRGGFLVNLLLRTLNLKARALAALKQAKDCQNFWLLLNFWKRQGMLDPGLFSAYICGPPKTDKTRLCARFMKLWPDCVAREGQLGHLAALERVNLVGYDLVLKTGRGVQQLANGQSMDWLFVTIEKNRFFGTMRPVEEDGKLPHRYDLTPRWHWKPNV